VFSENNHLLEQAGRPILEKTEHGPVVLTRTHVERYYRFVVLIGVAHRFSVIIVRGRIRSFRRRRRVRRRPSVVHPAVASVDLVRRRPAPGRTQRSLLRQPRRRVALPPVADDRTAEQAAEDATEALAEDAVDDEVGGRVDDDQQVAQVRRVDERVRAVDAFRVLDRLEDCQHAVRRVAQYDHHDDDDDDMRDVLLLRPIVAACASRQIIIITIRACKRTGCWFVGGVFILTAALRVV